MTKTRYRLDYTVMTLGGAVDVSVNLADECDEQLARRTREEEYQRLAPYIHKTGSNGGKMTGGNCFIGDWNFDVMTICGVNIVLYEIKDDGRGCLNEAILG